MRIFRDLRERRLAQYTTVYAGVGWVVLQLVDQFIQNGILPAIAYPLALVLFIAGLPGILIVTWFHGAAGSQSPPAAEKWSLAAVVLLALAAGWVVVRAGTGQAEGTGADARSDRVEDPGRVAVLYFDERGAGEQLQALSAGLTESLIDELSTVDALTVVSRNGVRLFRGKSVAADSIGRALNVGTIIDGNVAAADGRIRLSVSIVDGASGERIDGFRLERPHGELFELQDTLVREASEILRRRIGRQVRVAATRKGTTSVAAWELTYQAEELERSALEQAAAGDLETASRQLDEADSLLARAGRLDPEWAEPPTARGWLEYRRSRLGGLDRSHGERIATGLEHAGRALSLAPDAPGALELRGTLRYWRYLLNLTEAPGDADRLFSGAEADFERTVSLDPRRASAWGSLSHLRMNKGDEAGAKVAALRSYERDPYLENANLSVWRLFSVSMDMGDAAEAAKWCREGERRFSGDFRFIECRMLLHSLEPDVAHSADALWALLGPYVELSPAGFQPFNQRKGRMLVAMGLARAGLADSARAVARSARGDGTVDPTAELSLYEAIVLSWIGDFDAAFLQLGRYLAANPGQIDGVAADDSWYLRELRAHPRWSSVVGAG